MGIDISPKREITLNESHDLRLVTAPEKNPKISRLKGFHVSSVYRRTKSGDFERDGNPFIYALKKTSGYKITTKELMRFAPSFYSILDKIVATHEAEFVLSMPSSHPIADYIAKRVARRIGATQVTDFFIKQTVSEALEQLDSESVSKRHSKELKSQVNTFQRLPPDAEVSLKAIPNKIRRYFPPVAVNLDYTGPTVQGRIILVDDLLSTGTTLVSAKNLATGLGLTCSGAICLLSDLG
ncbi:MAG: hypothetical protein N0E42_12135 [Candidatus Thiodiazotropha endolucinida]|nr:hypothetical protein [Candidatus Thiodiazotropha taylori]MCW4225220.1 hypothetical protein [Candidatus Thiodiazotropha endolucinida]MCG7880772.1 hypothetical protein [Candidatus Thiodiazotropha taylori]MCG7886791.1 hypothetical protein [Candidatus Thiodiazotropha taylori]MCG8028178.1 hypothetical protein [Candidatus Thiodiazotropha taylori]